MTRVQYTVSEDDLQRPADGKGFQFGKVRVAQIRRLNNKGLTVYNSTRQN